MILHAGGKFGGGGYAVSGGLHVGISVVNALSTPREREIRRQGYVWRMSFATAAPPSPPRTRRSNRRNRHHAGSSTRTPDRWNRRVTSRPLRQRFQQMAFLNRGSAHHLTDEREFATGRRRRDRRR